MARRQQSVGTTIGAADEDTQAALDDMKRAMSRNVQYSNDAPTADIPGREGWLFYKKGATSSDPLTPYIYTDGEWWGG